MAYESAKQVSPRPKEKFGWKSVKPLGPYRAWVEALTDEGDLVVEPCAGTAPASIAAEQLGRDWVAIDIEPEAKEAYTRRRNSVFQAVEQPTLFDSPAERS